MNFSKPYINAAIRISPIGYSSVPLQRIHTQIFLYSHHHAVSLTEISGRCSCMLLPTPAIIFWYRQHYSPPTMYCLYFLIYFLWAFPQLNHWSSVNPWSCTISQCPRNYSFRRFHYIHLQVFDLSVVVSLSLLQHSCTVQILHMLKPITCLGILTFM